jgi:hypothetical protein
MFQSGRPYSPQVFDLDYMFGTNFFEFPYLNRSKMREYAPPSLDQVESEYDVLMFNDVEMEMYPGIIQGYGAMEIFSQWRAFYQSLDSKYEVIIFRAKTPNYCVSETRYYIINPSVLRKLPNQGVAELKDWQVK